MTYRREGVGTERDVRIVSAVETRYTRKPAPDTTTGRLLADAARLAIDEAGLSPADVDGLGVSSFSLSPDRAIDLTFQLGLAVSWIMDAGTGGASGIDMLQHAADAIVTGSASCILLLAGDVLRPADSLALSRNYNVARRDHLAPTNAGSNALFALLTRRHMDEHDLSREAYATVPLKQRDWATRNPGAIYRDPLTLDDYLTAPLVADPLSIYDCVPVVAGANALIVSTGDRGVAVRALGSRHNPDSQIGDGLRTGLADLRHGLWARAGLQPDHVDVISVYDDYPVMVLVQLGDLGFGDPTAVLDAVEHDRLAVNTSGGQLSAGQAGAAGGMHGLVEVVRQLGGKAGARQVGGARFGLVTGYGMVAYRYGACANVAILESE
jgi:acetyl-CoA acetyltransferase